MNFNDVKKQTKGKQHARQVQRGNFVSFLFPVRHEFEQTGGENIAYGEGFYNGETYKHHI